MIWGTGVTGNGKPPVQPQQQRHRRHHQRGSQPAKATLFNGTEQPFTSKGAERLADARSCGQSTHGNAEFMGCPAEIADMTAGISNLRQLESNDISAPYPAETTKTAAASKASCTGRIPAGVCAEVAVSASAGTVTVPNLPQPSAG